jgi:hypothetical protein
VDFVGFFYVANYELSAEGVLRAFGLSSSTIYRRFVKASSDTLKKLIQIHQPE